ncbi:ATP-binding protein [Streptomyces sp. FR-008]|uniref:ATP-binding protein n=1 Tax=Streptomyces sp. FR-008 TaxID=206662 RepID=UPI0007210CEA|nr:ATP-binding protein [Streptomyces sp. FR-008]ALM40633.1 regulatory protein [Streptomyces sp. FR-008]KAF0792495.1 regulatory protein [Streptomyces sp. FR-008]
MHEYMSGVRVWGLSCPGFPEEVSRARRWTRDILRGSPLTEDAELIVSELSANAILHTASGQPSGTFHLALAVSPQVIALSVTDEGGAGTAPKVEHQDEDQEAEHGRGLGMISAIAHRVVVHDSHGGYTVTAELLTDVGSAGGQPR